MSNDTSLAELMRSLDTLGAAEWWNHRSATGVDNQDASITASLYQAVENCKKRAAENGATSEQIEDALSYVHQLVLRKSVTRPTLAGRSAQQFLDSLN